MEQYLFVDLSYFVFFRFFALQRWCKISKYEFKDDDEFLAKFTKLFEDNLVILKKKHKVEWNRVYLAKDCMRNSIWRLTHFPNYKQNRDGNRQEFDPNVFVQAYQVILPNLVNKFGLHVVDFPNAEADDVIAVMHKMVREKHHAAPITVVTNDNDYVQLADKYTLLINLNKKVLTERFDDDMMSCFKLWKIIKGDTSDNIPPIDKNIGDKTALKLAKNPDALEKRIQSNPDVRIRFELNRQLIDFESIPTDIDLGIRNAFCSLI
jgi:5'-3' exonuclease